MSMICDTDNNRPHIVMISCDDDSEEYMNVENQFFISIEQQLCLECSNIEGAVFHLIAAHYVFNIDYHNKAHDALLFIQENFLALPSSSARNKKGLNSSSHIQGIQRFYS